MKNRCSICGTEYEYQQEGKLPPNFPFCSKRCKLIDLGKWLNEEYKISIPLKNVGSLSEEELREIATSLVSSGKVDFIEDEAE